MSRRGFASAEPFLEAESGEGENRDTETKQRHSLGPQHLEADTL
jgi:hypothetical protein